MKIPLFPPPRHFQTTADKLDLRTGRRIVIESPYSANLLKHTVHFRTELQPLFRQPLSISRSYPETGNAWLVLKKGNPDLQPGAYRLVSRQEAPDRGQIILEAAGEAAAFYGLQTLAQLLKHQGLQLPSFVIEDSPAFPQRGVSLDISRCKVPNRQTLEQLIRLFASLKLNQLQLYMEHTYAFSAHQRVWFDASPLSATDILELDAFCREYYMELVPNLNSFGHFERWLKHPAYHYLAESPEGFVTPWGYSSPTGSTLCPGETSLAFLDSLYREFLPNFSSSFFNVGLDEPWELGLGKSREICNEKGTVPVYLDFLKQIYRLVTKHKKKMMFWGDIIIKKPELIKEIPEDVTAMLWGYSAAHSFEQDALPFAREGLSFYVCPGTSSWNALSGYTDNCQANLANAASQGLARGASGYLITDWGDNGHHQYLPVSYPGFVAGAGAGWSGKKIEEEILITALDNLVFKSTRGSMGKLWLELGRAPDIIPLQVENGTILNRLFFHDLSTPFPGLNAPPLKKCLEFLGRLEDELAGIHGPADDTGPVREEFANAVAMCRHALQRGLLLSGEKINKEKMQRELENIILQHQYLWLQRNRPGGLAESTGYIRQSLMALDRSV